MDIKPYDKTIRDLFGSRRQFLIPRFQREYSWDKKNYEEFLVDMLDNLTIIDGKIAPSQYFLGTMLFIGNFTEATDQTIDVVDGQQRLTTITILFSALSDVFKEMNEKELSTQVFKYIMTKDDDGKTVRVLQSKTHYPYFSYFIQDIDKKVKDEPKSEEEICIKNTYDFFYSRLSENNLKSVLAKRYRDSNSPNYIFDICEMKDVDNVFLALEDYKSVNQNNQIIGMIICPIFFILATVLLFIIIKHRGLPSM